MGDDIRVIRDDHGMAVLGSASSVERFLTSEGLPSRDLELQRLGSAFGAGAAIAQAGSEAAATSGRWVKLTKASAEALEKYPAMKGSTADVSRAIMMDKGKTKAILEFAKSSPASIVANPAMLAGAAGIMAQIAMQQTMEEITDYLAVIDAKVDDILRAQKDAVLADMIGVDFVIEEAMTIRSATGRVSETTWSKVQAASMVIGRTQGYALRQLDALAHKLETASRMGDVAQAAQEAEGKGREWLAVLARCFQLQDASAVLELDRVLDATPWELDQHRVGIQTARRNRQHLITRSTARLMARIDAAANLANTKVLLHPTSSRAVVRSGNHVSTAVVEFHGLLGLQESREALEAKRWIEAANETGDRMLETGSEGVDAARRLGQETFERARSASGKFSSGIAARAIRLRNKSRGEGEG